MPGSQNTLLPFKLLKLKPLWHLGVATIILIGYGYSFGLFVSQSNDFIKAYDYSLLPKITLPYTCDFSDSALSTPHKYHGWSDSEKWGTWSKDSNPILAFRLDESIKGKQIRLSFQFHHFYVNDQNKKIEVDVHINDSRIDTWIFKQRTGSTKELDLFFDSKDSTLEIEFQIDGILSPAEAFKATDKRKLGIGLAKLSIQEIDTKL